MVEVVELTPKGRIVRLHCEASVDGKVVLDGEAVVSVPAPRAASGHYVVIRIRSGRTRPPISQRQAPI